VEHEEVSAGAAVRSPARPISTVPTLPAPRWRPGPRRALRAALRAALAAAASLALLLGPALASFAATGTLSPGWLDPAWRPPRARAATTTVATAVPGLSAVPAAMPTGAPAALIGGYWLPPIPSDAPAAPSSTDPAQYVREYGFDQPGATAAGLSPAETQRLAVMLPFASAAAARWDARYGDALEPQMLLFWTHAEGIGARVSYSNCANEAPPGGQSYFQYLANCDTPDFWQLGYGNQFSRITILKTAFIDMRGNPDDPQLVQRVGQAVLDWDQRQGATPACGGYSCTFPALTIDQIMAGVSLTSATPDNWWASVLSRDPAINCYMLARTLAFFNHAETQNWVGCYYAEPCWQRESNSLGDVLAAWPGLLRAAGLS
jgi:hypothetical protein